MRRREVVERIEAEARRSGVEWTLERRGANHDVYSLAALKIPIARHRELGNRYAEMVWKECEPVLGAGWWR